MTLTVSLVLLLLALVFLVAHAMGKFPLWPAVLCLILQQFVLLLPAR